MAEVADQGRRAFEPLDVRDQLGCLDRVDELPPARLADPSLDGGDGRPGVEGGVEFDCLEAVGIVGEPVPGRKSLGIETASPVPVEPPRAANVDAAKLWRFRVTCPSAFHASRAACILAARPEFSTRCFARRASRLARRSSRVGLPSSATRRSFHADQHSG